MNRVFCWYVMIDVFWIKILLHSLESEQRLKPALGAWWWARDAVSTGETINSMSIQHYRWINKTKRWHMYDTLILHLERSEINFRYVNPKIELTLKKPEKTCQKILLRTWFKNSRQTGSSHKPWNQSDWLPAAETTPLSCHIEPNRYWKHPNKN